MAAPVKTVQRAEAPWFADRVGGAGQVISVVGAGGSNATVSTWQKSGSDRAQVPGDVAAKVGSPGISSSYGEFSPATPAGVFAITGAFGRQVDPGAGLSYFRIDNSDWCVSDVNSPTTTLISGVLAERARSTRARRRTWANMVPSTTTPW